ncbi:tetratricopeptide repeat protein [Pseudobacteriovorax antillogorgiicola]|uniref:Uncharacterized protein n=1 Tax=Pseudobacteriovorax antillogorgiicola TaxID=1513793 RepID=A0A1Y6BM65_9BACT|nr:tetratricopeptide repeat protein [Pseudobacteriovorax antillogorgiicola]TCS55581.1 hypothetical protein EDD56_105307 [Pseudobacteriovorax antillogorgiicola]SMF10644.1 hypothetical protein SAMN06296036_10517 [Pseudobacteriovorax antillogorgiicola]
MSRILFLVAILGLAGVARGQDKADKQEPLDIDKPIFKPFIERYILDELKNIRADQQHLKAETYQLLSSTELKASDRAIRYTTDTVNNVFFIITAAASLVVLLGWRSIKDIRENVADTVENRVLKLTQEYEQRLDKLEQKLKTRSEQIIATQQEVANANQIHALWMRSGLEENPQRKIDIYDKILAIHPEDVEALTYKADTLLDLGEVRWAYSLTNRAVDLDDKYPLAYWQRACAHTGLNRYDAAIDDIDRAIALSPGLKKDLADEQAFEKLATHHRFKEIIASIPPETTESPRQAMTTS